MRAFIQRVSESNVEVDGKVISAISNGLLILLGVEINDEKEDATYLAKKISQLRIFSDSDQNMNLNINEAQGAALVVSQFTLHASTKKGNRPSFIKAAKPEQANALYEFFISCLSEDIEQPVVTGIFGEMMSVHLVNDGPVTILIDSKNKE